MNRDFKENVILLMQHPIMRKPLSDLSEEECLTAYELLKETVELSINDEFTRLDFIQLARLQFYLGDLANILDGDMKDKIYYYKAALLCLEKGGIDLGLDKWAELISLRTAE